MVEVKRRVIGFGAEAEVLLPPELRNSALTAVGRRRLQFPPAAIPDTLLLADTQSNTGGHCMAETESRFEGIRGFLRLAVGFLLLAVALGCAIYIAVRLLDYL
jgi:hypothetical protein